MVEAGDRVAMAGAILELLGDRPLADRLARRGREVASRFHWSKVAAPLIGTRLEDDAIAAACAEARKLARPMETSDMPSSWRRRVLPVAVRHALREVRGDDVTDARRRYGPQALL